MFALIFSTYTQTSILLYLLTYYLMYWASYSLMFITLARNSLHSRTIVAVPIWHMSVCPWTQAECSYAPYILAYLLLHSKVKTSSL